MTENQLLTINQFALLCRTTIRTLRFYDEIGLLKPARVDQYTKYRYYSPPQMRDFFRIKLLHTFNLPLKEVDKSLKSKNKPELLDKRLETLDEEIKERQREYRFLETMRKFLFETGSAEKYLEKKTFGPYLLFCKLVDHGQYSQINAEIFGLLKLAKKLKINVTQKQMVFYLDPLPYKPKDTRLEIGLICKGLKEKNSKILPPNHYFRTFPKSNVRVFEYVGPFEYITLIYQKFHEKRQSRILKPEEQGFDIHIRGPWNEKSEYSYLTEIVFPNIS